MSVTRLAPPQPAPGSLLLSEIREQPAALERLLEHSGEYAAVAAVARDRGLDVVRMVGHGSSDNAASYGVYAFGLLPRWTALRDSISLSVYYGAEIDLRGSCIVALSQSGETPDVLAYVERARARGALTIAVTNDPESALGQAAELVLPLAAGPERSIAATKTYTTQVAALALLAAHVAGQGPLIAEIAGAAFSIPVPTPRMTLLSPLLSVVPGQLFAWALAQAKGRDPDHPNGLSKITQAL